MTRSVAALFLLSACGGSLAEPPDPLCAIPAECPRVGTCILADNTYWERSADHYELHRTAMEGSGSYQVLCYRIGGQVVRRLGDE